MQKWSSISAFSRAEKTFFVRFSHDFTVGRQSTPYKTGRAQSHDHQAQFRCGVFLASARLNAGLLSEKKYRRRRGGKTESKPGRQHSTKVNTRQEKKEEKKANRWRPVPRASARRGEPLSKIRSNHKTAGMMPMTEPGFRVVDANFPSRSIGGD